jgi:hypothetical protein
MPKCPGCGNETAANVRFCPICGRATGAAAGSPSAAPSQPNVAPATNGSKTAAYIGGGVAALALLGFLALKASGLLGAKPTAAPAAAVLSAPTTQVAQAPVLAAPAVQPPAAPVIQPPVVAGNPMPADLVDYLRWLKQFESARQQLEAQGTGQLSAVLATVLKNSMTGGVMQSLLSDDPTEASAKPAANTPIVDMRPFDATIRQWNQAAGLFQQKAPPAPAGPLASTYNAALSESVSQMSAVTATLKSTLDKLKSNNGQGTPDIMQTFGSLQTERTSRQGSKSIDALYSDADAALDAMRNQYTQVPPDIDGRHFEIKVQTPSGGAIPGFGI